MKTRTLAKLIVFGGTALACLGFLELGIRICCRHDEDGNYVFRLTRLKPYHLTIKKSKQIIAEYLARKDSALIYDRDIGWNQRPNLPKNHHNAGGFVTSSGEETSRELPTDRMRIGVFGGSYTEGTFGKDPEESFKKGWWHVLEESLNKDGVKTEVLNFGVAAYGMDQAYLRWKKDGAPFHPHVVIFGFTAGNCRDNINMVRIVRDLETAVPFTKPRFLVKNGELDPVLLNSPTPSPAELPDFFDHLTTSPLLANEPLYHAPDFQMTFWRHSKLLALAEGKMAASREKRGLADFYRLGGEPAEVALGIMRCFKRDAERSGSTFYIAHLPNYIELEYVRAHGKFPYQGMLDEIDKIAPTIHTEQALSAACAGGPAERLFVDGHYGEQLQAVVGHEIANFVAKHADTSHNKP